jgi:hypothetical protein
MIAYRPAVWRGDMKTGLPVFTSCYVRVAESSLPPSSQWWLRAMANRTLINVSLQFALPSSCYLIYQNRDTFRGQINCIFGTG